MINQSTGVAPSTFKWFKSKIKGYLLVVSLVDFLRIRSHGIHRILLEFFPTTLSKSPRYGSKLLSSNGWMIEYETAVEEEILNFFQLSQLFERILCRTISSGATVVCRNAIMG